MIYYKVFNLINKDSRPCLILLLKNELDTFVVMNSHMPCGEYKEKAIRKMQAVINSDEILKHALYNDNTKVIMFGDFNDNKTTIHKNKPLKFKQGRKTLSLKHKMTQRQTRKTLRSCCWHRRGHMYKYFSDTGDYILVNENIVQKYIKIPSIYKVRGRNNRLFSDHMPVISKLVFK